jgi:hypothetical protein
MAIFAVVSLDQDIRLGGVVVREFPTSHFAVAHGHWLVAHSGTATEIGTKLGTSAGSVGQVVIYNIGGYYGYAPNPVWEWIKANWGTVGG